MDGSHRGVERRVPPLLHLKEAHCHAELILGKVEPCDGLGVALLVDGVLSDLGISITVQLDAVCDCNV